MTAPVFTVYKLFPREPLRALVEVLMEPVQVQWVGDPQRFVGPLRGKPGARIEIDVLGHRELGTNEVRKALDSVKNANLVTLVQQQVFVLTFRCDSWSFDVPAYDTLTQMYLRLRRASSIQALADSGISMGKRGRTIEHDMKADNRPIYSSSFDCEFNFCAAETDETDAGGVIDFVNANPALLNPANPVGDIPDVPALDATLGTQ